jgi:hypothetical protein
MATAKTLWKLHSTGAQPPEPAPVKSSNFEHLQIDVSAPAPAPPVRERRQRGRFAIEREPEAQAGYSLTTPEVMSIMSAEAATNTDRFADMRERERLAALLQSRTRLRGHRGNAGQWPFANRT